MRKKIERKKKKKLRNLYLGEYKMVVRMCVVGKYLYPKTCLPGMAQWEFLLSQGLPAVLL